MRYTNDNSEAMRHFVMQGTKSSCFKKYHNLDEHILYKINFLRRKELMNASFHRTKMINETNLSL